MRRPLSDSEVIGAAFGTVAALVVAGLLGSIRTEISQANAALILVLVIIAAATIGGRWAGGATALAAAVSFDFFLTKPYGSLAIKSGAEIVTTVLLFITGIAVGQIVGSGWRAKSGHKAGVDEVAGLHRVAALVADGNDLMGLIAAVETEVARVVLVGGCTYSLLPPDPARPVLDANGKVDAKYVHVGDGFALPPEGIMIPVRTAGRVLGWLTCDPPSTLVGVSHDRRRTALILAGLLAAALDRSDSQAA